jgi:DNA mismatch repair protein MutL
VGGVYVVLETEDGYVVMDPQAAHERVLFERVMRAAIEGEVESQTLLIPETAELSSHDAAILRKHLDLVNAMGFGVSEFGGNAFVVDAVPACLKDSPSCRLIVEIPGTLEQAGSRHAKGRWREESIAKAACRAAVTARDRLTLEEIERLVIDLARTRMPYTCPHGRPTLIFTPFRELNRKFGRDPGPASA